MMETDKDVRETVVTQVSFGGFDKDVTAKELVAYLDDEIGVVWRCRLKTSWTPPESYPNFEITNAEDLQTNGGYRKVVPHAFVHFASSESATWAKKADQSNKLFLNGKPLKVSLGPENPYQLNQRRRETIPRKLSNLGVELGTLTSLDEFMVGWRGPTSGVDFYVDPFDGMCRFCFTKDTAFSFKGKDEHEVLRCDYKLEFLVREIRDVKQYTETLGFVIILRLASAPFLWYRTADDDIEVPAPFDLLDDDDPWIRTTDFTPSGAIGRCNSYRISVPPRHGVKLKRVLNFLKERRVQEVMLEKPIKIRDEPEYGTPMSDPFFAIHHKKGIAFEVNYLVNAVMHRGIFNQYQLSESFFDLLRGMPVHVNVAALKHICSYNHPVLDAHKRLRDVQEWLLKNPKLLQMPKKLDNIAEIRRLAVTPTRGYCLPPEVELSNRVLRHYKEIGDRFLRVTFMDEGLQTITANVLTYYAAPIVRDVTKNSFSQKTRIFKRVKSILTDGFHLCGRKYSFLAFSSNQLRDRSAWFFAEDAKTSVREIRAWMGKFKNRNVAKCAARMGQCFSSTYATVEVPSNQVNKIPDIERNKYTFSDGIGRITPDLAKEVAEKLKLDSPPCAYQIRYGGCKGVIVCWPADHDGIRKITPVLAKEVAEKLKSDDSPKGVVACWPAEHDGVRLSLRPSMKKFESEHTILEICSWTRFQPGFLNRQIITLLSALQVPDEIFWKMQIGMLAQLDTMLEDVNVAFDVITASCAEQGHTAAIMLSAGFKPKKEPHLRGMLTCIRAAQLWGLREKTRIFVPSGRWLMGCFDELGVLEYGQCFIQVSNPSLESCFTKHGSSFRETRKNLQVIKGTVVMAKNPCLHPGDVRILEAVDAPELHHLHDCLVFPQKGPRPHPNEASGSDLDGDLYFVTWDVNLIPPTKRSWPAMEYDAAETKQLNRAVSHEDIIEFFARNMVNESLGAICNAHVVHADLSPFGALDEKCISLAELAATAVDFPKTGKVVTMPHHLKPKMYPDYMGKEEYQTYKSTKILGKLYRNVLDAYNDDDLASSSELDFDPTGIPYDKNLEKPGSAQYIDDAWNQKCSYDRQLKGLLGQYAVKREEEIVTGHIWSMPTYNSRKQGELKERLKHSYSSLKKEFRQVFEKMDSDFDPDFEKLTDEEKNLRYEQKASAWYQVAYHPEWIEKSLKIQKPVAGSGSGTMLSFAWIAADYLARIKIKCRGNEEVIDTAKPVNSLVKFLADRM